MFIIHTVRTAAFAALLALAARVELRAQESPRPAPVPAAAPAPARAPLPAVAPTPASAINWELSQSRAQLEREYVLTSALETTRWRVEGELASTRGSLESSRWKMETELALARGGLAVASFATSPRGAWAQGDPGDSLYRLAREQLNRGDYRSAVALFKEIPLKYPSSAYAAEAPYWHAFALYRIGATGDLQEALQLLESQRSKFPGARTQADAAALATRIAGVLVSRGQGNTDLVKRSLAAANAAGAKCDREDLSVRSEALNALMQTAPETAMPMAQKILDRRDECSTELRRSALYLVGNRRDATGVGLVIQVARTEPDADVRSDAIGWLGRFAGDEALNVLEEIAGKSDDERAQRSAVRALAAHSNPRARTAMRALAEKSDVPERLRLAVVEAFDNERTTLDDATWLRSLYAKTDNQRIKSRVIGVLARVGGDANAQFLAALVRNEAEPGDARASALRAVGRTMDVASLGKFYDAVAQRPLREQIIDLLGNRAENEATDKLIEIVRGGTDPQLRRQAIAALTRKKDPRTTKLLMEIIDK